MIYEWGSQRFGVDAQLVGQTVERLAKENGGACPPGCLVVEAEPADSPLHPLFTWNDERAAESWRRQEARQVIKSLVVVIDESDSRPPAFVHIKVTHDGGDVEGYAETIRVVGDAELRKQALAEAVSVLRGLRRRYEALSELRPVWEAFDALAG